MVSQHPEADLGSSEYNQAALFALSEDLQPFG
jgi:hypothetical protein